MGEKYGQRKDSSRFKILLISDLWMHFPEEEHAVFLMGA